MWQNISTSSRLALKMAVMVLPDTAGVSLTNMRASGLRTVDSRERGREIKLVSRLVIPRWIPFLNFGLYVSYCYLRQLILLKASTGFSSVGQVHSYCLSSFNDSIHMSSLFCSEGRRENKTVTCYHTWYTLVEVYTKH